MNETPLMYGGVEVHHPQQFLGLMAVHKQSFDELIAQVRHTDARAHVLAWQQAMDKEGMQAAEGNRRYVVTRDGVAVVDLVGGMTKFGSSFTEGTVSVRRALRQAARDEDVKAIVLRIDSPGGSVAGTDDLAADVAEANRIKPVVAYIEDLGASAAYWVASQAGRIAANTSAFVGSIGVYMLIDDVSAMFAAEGIKTHLIKAGQFKGSGAEGTEITEEQLTEWQRLVNSTNDLFVATVAAGRKVSSAKVAEWNDGRVHPAREALRLGLIDEVSTLDSVLSALGEKVGGERRGRKAMAETNAKGDPVTAAASAEPQAEPVRMTQVASIQELRAAIPKADDGFLVKALTDGLTIQQAKDRWAAKLEADLEATQAENKKLSEKAKKPGFAPSHMRGEAADKAEVSAETRFKALVEEKVKGGMSREMAVAAVVREEPELQQAFIAESRAKAAERIKVPA